MFIILKEKETAHLLWPVNEPETPPRPHTAYTSCEALNTLNCWLLVLTASMLDTGNAG